MSDDVTTKDVNVAGMVAKGYDQSDGSHFGQLVKDKDADAGDWPKRDRCAACGVVDGVRDGAYNCDSCGARVKMTPVEEEMAKDSEVVSSPKASSKKADEAPAA